MTDRITFRAALRQRLEDTTLDPLWDDAALDEALAAAIRAYGLRAPTQVATAVAIAAGATEAPLPSGLSDPSRLVRVIDPRGHVVPPAAGDPLGPPATGPVAQSWRVWSGVLRLSQPALGGDWRLEHLAPRRVPGDDLEEVDVDGGDEELVLVLALAAALGRRAVEDGKRGARGELARLADAARAEAASLFVARRRRVRGGWLAAH